MTIPAGAKRTLVPLLVVYALTRVALAYLADNPAHYGTPTTTVVGDVDIYQGWATQVVDSGLAPYSEVAIEYPPGALPFALGPRLLDSPGSYRERFIALMLLVDAAGLAGLYVIGRRRGSLVGCWAWVAGVTAIGPILLLRLDLVPAVATIWAVERASAGSWGGAGGWLGLGFVVKIYPLFLLPVALVLAAKRRLVAAGFLLVTAVSLLPFVRALEPLFRSVVEYHTQRGLQVESAWAALLLTAGHFGYDVAVQFNFGAFHLASGLSESLKTVADAASLGALGAGTAIAAGVRRVANPDTFPEMMMATLACVMALGTVFSPQFMVWILALAAAVLCARRSPVAMAAAAVVPLCALTQLVYPFLYDHLVLRDAEELPAELMLVVRDAGLLAIGVTAFVLLYRSRGPELEP